MRIYISGKIGEDVISDATREKFARAEKMLMERLSEFSEVINPTSEAYQETLDHDFQWRQIPSNYDDILLYDLQWIRTCDAVYMLDDYHSSDGATAELSYACATGKRICFQDEGDARSYLGIHFTRKVCMTEPYCSDKRPWNKVRDEYVEKKIDNTWLPIED